MEARSLAPVRGHNVAESRRRQGLTQPQVAQSMGVSVREISHIQHGDVSGLNVLDRYVTAFGGQLGSVATFGDEQRTFG